MTDVVFYFGTTRLLILSTKKNRI